jgi:hypothetical protein
MRKKLCFNCRDLWVPGHRCLGKGQIHYIEVASDSEEEEINSTSIVAQRRSIRMRRGSLQRNLSRRQNHSQVG